MAYTNIDDPSAYFQTALYAGNGTGQTITNDGNSDLKPDFLWFKNRNETVSHTLWDSTRGITKFLVADSTASEYTNASGYELTSFNTDGFGLGAHNNAGINQSSSYNYVAWQWKANGGTTTAFNESGSNPGGTRQTNTDAGFSIISYTGTGSNGTIAHGLPSTPEMIIFKRRNNANVWTIWHQGIGDDYKLVLNETAAKDSDGAFMNSTLPTSTNITVGGASVNTNADNGTYICYAFSPVQGYSKFGSYVGNGNANGTFVYTGFKPAWVMTKRTDGTSGWFIQDIKRGIRNSSSGTALEANSNLAESGIGATNYDIDFLSNGFKLRQSNVYLNASGGTYIYMAFAENPFTTSTGIPTTAR